MTRFYGTITERMWARVDKTDTCWLYTGRQNANGYGVVDYSVGDRGPGKPSIAMAHRLAYEDAVGPVPEGLDLDHLCRVRHCVRPDHLEPVTRAENLRRGVAARIHACPHGHPYTEENTAFRGANKTRRCLTCDRETARRWKREKAVCYLCKKWADRSGVTLQWIEIQQGNRWGGVNNRQVKVRVCADCNALDLARESLVEFAGEWGRTPNGASARKWRAV